MVGGHVVDSKYYTTYSSTIKDMYVWLIILIAVKNRLGLMDVYIGNLLCTTPCDENICSCFNVEFGPRCVASVVLKRDLYGLKMASNSFQKYFGYFIRDLGFTPPRAYQDLWIQKSVKLWGMWLHCNTCGWCNHFCRHAQTYYVMDYPT